MKIVTLTLNPAFDLHCYSENFRPYFENVATVTDYNAGGKGINISRALLAGGVSNRALVIVGQTNGTSYLEALSSDGVETDVIITDGRIRENITLHTENAPETRISFRGFTADESLLCEVENRLSDLDSGDVLTLTGSNPKGFEPEAVKAMLGRIKKRGIKIVVDSNSFTLDDLMEIKPWLIKPNGEEIGKYAGEEPDTIEKAMEAAQKLHEKGIENAMISLGERGAVLASEDGCYHALPPKCAVVSTIGAGDSAIAGFITAYKKEESSAECLRTAVAYGSAACMTSGTNPPKMETIESLRPQILLKKA